MRTKPFRFSGDTLFLNFSTSAAGFIKTEILDMQGNPIEGFEFKNAKELIGNEIEKAVSWQGDRGAVSGRVGWSGTEWIPGTGADGSVRDAWLAGLGAEGIAGDALALELVARLSAESLAGDDLPGQRSEVRVPGLCRQLPDDVSAPSAAAGRPHRDRDQRDRPVGRQPESAGQCWLCAFRDPCYWHTVSEVVF